MTRGWRFGLITLLLCGASPALAGSDPLYQAAPGWVVPEVLTADQLAKAPTIVLASPRSSTRHTPTRPAVTPSSSRARTARDRLWP